MIEGYTIYPYSCSRYNKLYWHGYLLIYQQQNWTTHFCTKNWKKNISFKPATHLQQLQKIITNRSTSHKDSNIRSINMADDRNYFHVVDYVLFVTMFISSMSIGLYFALAGGGQKSTEEYLMGSRNMKLFPVATSLAVSVISANTLLGAPAEVYAYGLNYWFMLTGLVVATLIVAFTFVPLLFRLRVISANEVCISP